MAILNMHLNSLDFSEQLETANQLLDNNAPSAPTARVTFWGSRIVEWQENGATTSIYLESLAEKILDAGRLRCEAGNLAAKERIAGMDLVKKVNRFYRITDAQNLNCLTRLLLWIREFSLLPYTTRFYFDTDGDGSFRTYSNANFFQTFGGAFDATDNHPAAEAGFSVSSPRIRAREDSIRGLLSHF